MPHKHIDNEGTLAIDKTKQWLIESVIKYQFCPYAKQPFQDNLVGFHHYHGDNIFALLEKLAYCCLELDGAINDGAINDGAINDGAINDGAINDDAINDGVIDDATIGDKTHNKKNKQELETTLLIISSTTSTSKYLGDFYDYLDALDIANAFLETPQKFIEHFSASFQSTYKNLIPSTWAKTYQLASFHPDYQFENATIEERGNYTNRSPYPIFHIIKNASIDNIRINDRQARTIVTRNIQTLENLSTEAFTALQKLAMINK